MDQSGIHSMLVAHESDILPAWCATAAAALGGGRITRPEIEGQCREIWAGLLAGLQGGGGLEIDSSPFAPLRERLDDLSRARAVQGFTSSETASFLFALKEPVFAAIRRAHASDGEALAALTWNVTLLIDRLGLRTTETFQKGREEVIQRQHQEISELSTPVVRLWKGILALPLIGTLDSSRTQVVMESLLERIVAEEAEIAIIDITGVPTVDTLVAQHLLKTVAAARLMGAECLISGIRPQIAQTMVHLGVELNVTSKASLADAFATALARMGRTVTAIRPPASPAARG
jgi:rsbT co-antagonist protein RsbR